MDLKRGDGSLLCCINVCGLHGSLASYEQKDSQAKHGSKCFNGGPAPSLVVVEPPCCLYENGLTPCQELGGKG